MIKRGIKGIAWGVLLIICLQQKSWATGETAQPLLPRTQNESAQQSIISHLGGPTPAVLKWGELKSIYQGEGPRFLVLVQDAHLNVEAQENIARILHYFSSRTGLKDIYLEGSSGELVHRPLSSHPNAKARRLTAEMYLRRGLLTGPEFAAVVRHPEWRLTGIENQALYEKNRGVFLRALDWKEQSKASWSKIYYQAQKLGAVIFSEDLRTFFSRKEAFSDEKLPLTEYSVYLTELARKYRVQGDFSQVERLAEIQKMPADKQKIESEKAAENITLTIFDQIEALQRELIGKMCVSAEESELSGIFLNLQILQKIFDFSFSHEDAVYFYSHRKEFDFVSLSKRLSRLGQGKSKRVDSVTLPEIEDLNEGLKKFVSFYETALARDFVLAQNTADEMQKQGVRTAALVTGGFHTSRIENFLRSKKISYCVVMPRIRRSPDLSEQERYVRAMKADSGGLFKALKAASLQHRFYGSDVRFQLQPPSRFISASALEGAGDALASQPLPALVSRVPALDFLLEAMLLTSVTDVRLSGKMNSSVSPRDHGSRSPEETRLSSRVYPLIYGEGARLVRGVYPGSGVLLGAFSQKDGVALHASWRPNAAADEWRSASARWITSDGIVTEISVLADAVLRRNLEGSLVPEKKVPLARPESRQLDGIQKGTLKISMKEEETDSHDSAILQDILNQHAVSEKITQDYKEYGGQSGPQAELAVRIRAHSVLEDGQKVPKPEAGQKEQSRVYKIILKAPLGRVHFVLTVNRVLAPDRALKSFTFRFEPYSQELNRLENLLINARKPDGSPVPLKELLGDVPKYSALYVKKEAALLTPGESFLIRPEAMPEPEWKVSVYSPGTAPGLSADAPGDSAKAAVYQSRDKGIAKSLSVKNIGVLQQALEDINRFVSVQPPAVPHTTLGESGKGQDKPPAAPSQERKSQSKADSSAAPLNSKLPQQKQGGNGVQKPDQNAQASALPKSQLPASVLPAPVKSNESVTPGIVITHDENWDDDSADSMLLTGELDLGPEIEALLVELKSRQGRPELRQRFFTTALLDVPALVTGAAIVGASPPGLAAGFGILLLVRTGFVLAVLLHEMFHLDFFQGKTGLRFKKPENRFGGHSPSDLLLSLLPFQPLIVSGAIELPVESSSIRKAGFFGSAAYTAVLLAMSYLSVTYFFPGVFFFGALLPGAASALALSFYSDLWKSGENCVYGCGNFGGVMPNPALKPKFQGGDENSEDAGDWDSGKSLSLEEFWALMEEITKIEVVRGEQAAGVGTYLQNRKGRTLVMEKLLKSKRGKLPAKMMQALESAVRNKRMISLFVDPLSGQLQFPSWVYSHGHSRFATGSRSTWVETQPHIGLPQRKVSVWSEDASGGYSVSKQNAVTVTAHNGDFDAWKLFGKSVSFDVFRDQWFPKVFSGLYRSGLTRRIFESLGVVKRKDRHPAVGDTPQLAQKMDFMFTQGRWEASLRRAYQFSAAKSIDDPAPSAKEIAGWTKLFDRMFEQAQSRRFVPLSAFSQKPSAESLKPLAAEILTVIAQDKSLSSWIPFDKRELFAREAMRAFFEGNLYEAAKEGEMEGSFGMVLTSSLEPEKVVFMANGQPISFAFYPEYNLILWSSEAAALKVKFKIGNDTQSMPFRFDLDQAKGQVVEMKLTQRGKPQLRVYSQYLGRELTPREVAASGRLIDMRDNSLVDPLTEFDWNDLTGQDERETSQVLEKIRRDWQDPESKNRQSAQDLLKILIEKDISKRMEREVNALRTPSDILRQIRGAISSLAARLMSGELDQQRLDEEIRRLASNYSAMINRKKDNDNLKFKNNPISDTNAVDVLITGYELSFWLGEQFGIDLHRMFPQLRIESVSSNAVLNAVRGANLKQNKGEFLIENSNRRFRVGRNTVVLSISQSGQTFGTLNATLALSSILPGRVFVMTGGTDTLMGQAVGQVYAKGAAFSRRIFDNLSGFRPAEPSSLSAAAAHATLTELLLYLGEASKKFYPGHSRPLGIPFEEEDFESLRKIRDEVTIQSAPSLTGFSAKGETLQSSLKKNLLRISKRWSQHILEAGVVTLIVALVVSSLVYYGIPFFPSQFAWFPRPSWLLPLMKPFVGSYDWLFPSVLDPAFFIPVGAAYFILFSYPFTLGLRALQRRFPLLQRTGKRTLTIGAPHFVHMILEMYLTKLFSLSYGFSGIEVHSGDARDHFLAQFAHRVARGSLLLLFRPDGRLKTQAGHQGAVDMTMSQAQGIENWKVGAEVWTVGRNPRTKTSTAGGSVVLPELASPVKISIEPFIEKIKNRLSLTSEQVTVLREHLNAMNTKYFDMAVSDAAARISQAAKLSPFQKNRFEEEFHFFAERQAALERIYDSRFDALEAMLAGFVLFREIGRRVSRFFSLFRLWWDMAASQSRARIFTTRSPVSAADMMHVFKVMEAIVEEEKRAEAELRGSVHKQEEPDGQLRPEDLPFKVVGDAAPAEAEASAEVPVKKDPPAHAPSSNGVSMVSAPKETSLVSPQGNGSSPVMPAAAPSSSIDNLFQQLVQKYGAISVSGRPTFRSRITSKVNEIPGFPVNELLASFDQLDDAEMRAPRGELRQAPQDVISALRSVNHIQRIGRMEREIPFARLNQKALRQGWDLLAALESFTQYQHPALSVSAKNTGSGELIFVYRPADHNDAFVKKLLLRLKAQQKLHQVTFMPGVGTSSEAWSLFKKKASRIQFGSGIQTVFSENPGSGALHALALSRLRAMGLSWDQVVQLPDRLRESSANARYYQAITLGAVPISNSTLLILGHQDALEQARVLQAEQIVGALMKMQGRKKFEVSA